MATELPILSGTSTIAMSPKRVTPLENPANGSLVIGKARSTTSLNIATPHRSPEPDPPGHAAIDTLLHEARRDDVGVLLGRVVDLGLGDDRDVQLADHFSESTFAKTGARSLNPV